MSHARTALMLGWVASVLLVAWPGPSSAAPARAARAPRSEARPAPAKKAWLGTALAPLGQVDRRQKGVPRYGGVLVERVLRDSPAGRTGILAGDVIMRLDDKYVYQPDEVIRRVETIPVGKNVKIDVIRNGGWLTASVKLTPRPGSVPPAPAKAAPQPGPEPLPAASHPAPRRPPRPAATTADREPSAPGKPQGASSLSLRMQALEREVRLLRQAILDQQKRCHR